MKSFRWLIGLALVPLVCGAQSTSARIGSVDFFGTDGINVLALRHALPFRSGGAVTDANFDDLKERAASAIVRVTGRPASDIFAVCCDTAGTLTIYIGLRGGNSRTLPHLPPPKGSACLPAGAVHLYNEMLGTLDSAVRSNDTGEDDSKGYSLAHDSALREMQLKMRAYAVAHATVLESTLALCRSPLNRQAAAEILGYADRSKVQISALMRASNDFDPTVRNNALRALWVLASSRQNNARLAIPAPPFVAMLNSGRWEDRNKAGLLLMALSEPRNPGLLSDLRTHALDSLVEMANWRDPGHALPYRFLLGRIAGLSDRRIRRLIASGRVDLLTAAAEKTQAIKKSPGA